MLFCSHSSLHNEPPHLKCIGSKSKSVYRSHLREGPFGSGVSRRQIWLGAKAASVEIRNGTGEIVRRRHLSRRGGVGAPRRDGVPAKVCPRILCRDLYRNRRIPARVAGDSSMSVGITRWAVNSSQTPMNTADPCYLHFFGVSPSRSGLRIPSPSRG